MTIRSGGRPRERRQPNGRRFESDAYATDYVPEAYEPSRRYGNGGNGGRRGGRRGSGLGGVIKFLLFALVLAGLVVLVLLTALRPLVNSAILSWAADSPAALKLPFVADLVRDDLGSALTDPVSDDPEQVQFLVQEGDTASTIAGRLAEQHLIRDPRAFVFIASDQEIADHLQQGTFVLRRNMTPDQVVTALLAPPANPFVEIPLRTGLRLEQITAKLQTLPTLKMDPREFYELANEPPAALIADYPWLQRILRDVPEGTKPSLEGFLWPDTYRVLPDTTPEELIRLMLDGFIANVTEQKLTVPAERGLTFYQVMALASIVEREAVLDEERPLIAGVYQNRIDGIPGIKNKILNADPTVIYAYDTVALSKLEFEAWKGYTFWKVPEGIAMKDIVLPDELAGFQTYTRPGLIPSPIVTPTVASIDAALHPDTADKYIYFLAVPDTSRHVFAKTAKEHDANRKKYGYT
ncbi:MAG TPA: endolytic transglycosylase MltG [Methylomirabilota bacterium]|nr:endolytic transglycosylase MltG [Methylomirabilota bacterium]